MIQRIEKGAALMPESDGILYTMQNSFGGDSMRDGSEMEETLDTEAVLQHLLEKSSVAQRLRVEGRCRGTSDLREIVAVVLDLVNDRRDADIAGISSKDQEFIDLETRRVRARQQGWTGNSDYLCLSCRAEGKSIDESTYLDWPAKYDNGMPYCTRHAEIERVERAAS
jgi:hypothetical protein